MVQYKKLFIAVFSFGLVVGTLAYAQIPSTSVSLVGKLVDPEGRAVKDAEARIIAFRDGELVREAAVSGDGRYELPLTSGKWIMFLDVKSGIGFLTPDAKKITVPSGVATYTWNPVLDRASGVIVGSLRSESGSRLGRALVNIVNLVTGKLSSSEETADGSYGIPVSSGTYSIEAFSSDGGVVNPAAKEQTIESGFADLKMIFRQSDGVISGNIGGVPAESRVSVAAWSDGGHQNQVDAEPSGGGYRYSLKVKKGDVWHLRAAGAGSDGRVYESVEYTLPVLDTAIKTQNFLLLPSSSATLPSNKIQVLDVNTGGVVSLPNGMVVSIPATQGNDTKINVNVVPSFIASPKQNIIGPVYRVSASRADGVPLERVNSGMVVGIPYTTTDLARANVKNVRRLRVSFWDEISRAWRIVPQSIVDEDKQIVYGYTKYLALLGVGGGGSVPSEGEVGETPQADTSVSAGSTGGGAAPVNTPQSMTAPSNLSVTATPTGFLSIRWFDFILKAGEVHDIERAPGTSLDFSVIAQNVQSPYTDAAVQPGATYRYRVVSRDDSGATAPSTSEIGTTPSDSKAPTVTVIVSVIQERNAAVSVTSDEQAIIAIRCLPSGGGESVEALLTNLVQAAVVPLSGLIQGTDYSCDITGTDVSGNTSPAAKATFRTLGTQTPATLPAQPPALPVTQPPVTQPTPPQFTFVRNMTFGTTGTDVRALQQVLISRGDLRITTPTQFFGQATRAALISFQRRNGLPGTGFFGPQTWALIKSGNYR